MPLRDRWQVEGAWPDKWIIEENGDSIWYDELDLIEKVEKRIGQEMKILDPDDFSVDGVLESPLPADQRKKKDEGPTEVPSRRQLKRKRDDSTAMVYGTKKNDISQQAVSKYASAIAPTVKELCMMEEKVQQLFARTMWGLGVVPNVEPVPVVAKAVAQEVPSISAAADTQLAGPDAKKGKKKVRW